MEKFAFISRHAPTPEQISLAEEKDIILEHIGYLDAFTVTPADVGTDYVGVVVVHPASALRLKSMYKIGIFENGLRPADYGRRPAFYAKALHLFE